jgi:hypothetical protein
MIDRRSLIATLGGAAAGVATRAAGAATRGPSVTSIPKRPDVSFLRTDALVNLERV